jgi:CO/xanthine dehydrogenase FAD-binding subunit
MRQAAIGRPVPRKEGREKVTGRAQYIDDFTFPGMIHAAQPLRQSFRKVGTRRAQAISKVCFAAACTMDNGRIAEPRIVFGSVAPVPVRCYQVERLLAGEHVRPALIEECRRKLLTEIAPIDDIRSTCEYRKRVAQNLLEEFLKSL